MHQNGSTVEQVNHYYPFGGLFDQTAETLQTYKYNGKELDRTYDIDLYDYSARYMDGALGRFTTMDPMAEKYYGISPYAYCANNPMRYVDPTGMEPEDDGMWTKLGHFLKDLFSIKIDTSSEEAGAKTSERYNQQLETIENITEGVETFNTTAAMIMPASSVVELSAAVFAGASAETIGVAAVSVAVDVVTGGKGKAVTQFISLSDIKRIENAASKIGKTINVVGSRAVPGKVENGINVAKGTPADWDYVIEGMTNKEWKKIKNSLPGAKSNIDNTPRNIDVFDKLDKSKPYIPIHPKNK
nr:RHS repeat-associated core domain-containing protein [Bacteroides sp. 51]